GVVSERGGACVPPRPTRPRLRRSSPRAFGDRQPRARRGTAACSARCPPPRGSACPSSPDRRRRDGEHERASLADFAVAPDATPVHLDEALRQGEPETGPFVLPRPGLGLLELLEDPAEVVLGDPGAG